MIHNQILKSLFLILLVKTKNKIDEIDFKTILKSIFKKNIEEYYFYNSI